MAAAVAFLQLFFLVFAPLVAVGQLDPVDKTCEGSAQCVHKSDCGTFAEALDEYKKLPRNTYSQKEALAELRGSVCNKKEHGVCCYPEKVYSLNKRGHIECNLDSDCPPTARPSWEWNEKTKMENGVSSITEMSIKVSRCSPAVVDSWGEYHIGGPSNISICEVKSEPFCGHQYGRNHPECKRCNVLTPLPEPQCLDFELNKRPKRIYIDYCCKNLFNVKFTTKTEERQLDGEDYYTNLRGGILQNFTINDCRLSALHIPPDSPPRTLFDPQLCCSFGFCRAACSNCIPASFGRLPPFLTAATGTGSLTPRRKSQSCPSAHCKRPSLARPGNLICCLLIRAPWGNRRIAICPYSCD